MRNKKIAIAVGILVVILLIVFFIGNKNKAEDPNNDTNNFSHITESGYDVSGTWYSYHYDSNRVYELDLKKDGTFISTWLEKGSYSVEKEKITLTDSFGLVKELELRPENTQSEFVLYFDNVNHSFVYYRTEAELEESTAKTEEEIEEMDKLYVSAIHQILTTGEWLDNSGETTLVFTENEYTATYNSSIIDKKEEVTNKYELLEYEADNNTYKMKWAVTDVDGLTHTINNIVISAKNETEYTLTSSSFPFATTFSKNVEIIFEQPCEATADNSNNVATEDDYSQAQGNNSNPSQNIVDRRIIENPEKDYEAIYKEIEKTLVGNWKGTFDDNITSNTFYWEYTFTENTYSFKSEDEEHKGTYMVNHDKDKRYHSTLVLDIEGNQSIEYDFYLAGNEVITLKFEDDNFPVFFKQ